MSKPWSEKYCKNMVPKTPVNIHYQNKYIDLLVILVPDNIVVESTARTSTPKNRLQMLFRKLVSKLAPRTHLKNRVRKMTVTKTSSTENLITVLNRPSKNRIQKKQYLEARQEKSFKNAPITPLKISIDTKTCVSTHQKCTVQKSCQKQRSKNATEKQPNLNARQKCIVRNDVLHTFENSLS